MPKDIHVEPERFAAELISRLETVLREREAQERLEERLKRVRLVSVCVCVQGYFDSDLTCDSVHFVNCKYILLSPIVKHSVLILFTGTSFSLQFYLIKLF